MKLNTLYNKNSTLLTTPCLVVSQEYSTKAEDEYVINGNDVLVKCKIPSFVSDFVQVIGWIDNDHKPILPGSNSNNFSHVYYLLPVLFLNTTSVL